MNHGKRAYVQTDGDLSRDELVAELGQRFDLTGVNIRRGPSPQPGDFGALPYMGQFWRHTDSGTTVLVLDNAPRPKTRRWCVEPDTGRMRWLPDQALEPHHERGRMPLEEVAQWCRAWARAGCPDAMNWLGYFYEYGTEDTRPDGLRALAYYMAAIRRDPGNFSHNFKRVWHDSINLFADRRGSAEIQAGARARARFIEFDPLARTDDGWVSMGDWREAIEIAERG